MDSEMSFLLLFLGIFILLVGGIIVLLIYFGRKRRVKEKLKTPADHYSNMRRDMRQWGWILIVFNGLALLGSLASTDPFLVAASIASFIAALVMGYLFITVGDALLFLAYGMMLAFYTLFDVLGAGMLGIPFAVLRSIWVMYFIRQFSKYRKHQAVHYEGRGTTTAQVREDTGITRTLTRIIIVTGLASGAGLLSLMIFGFLYGAATGGKALDLPFGLLVLEQALLLLGIVAAALTIAVRVEGMDPTGLATMSGVVGGFAVLTVLALSVLGPLAEGVIGAAARTSIPARTPTSPNRVSQATSIPSEPDQNATPVVAPASVLESTATLQLSSVEFAASDSPLLEVRLSVEGEPYFGASLDLDGDLLLVGAPRGPNGLGRVYVYARNGFGQWNQRTGLNGPGVDPLFGSGVFLEDDLAWITPGCYFYQYQREADSWGSVGYSSPSCGSYFDGRRYVYTATPPTVVAMQADGIWATEGQLILPSQEQPIYGSFDLEGDTVIASLVDNNNQVSGIAIFRSQQGQWQFLNQLFIDPSDETEQVFLYEGNTIALNDAEGVYFVVNTSPNRDWTTVRTSFLEVPHPLGSSPSVQFAIDGDYLVASRSGSYQENTGTGIEGIAFLYRKDSTTAMGWSLIATLTSPLPVTRFGGAIDVDDGIVVIGTADNSARDSRGDGYLFIYETEDAAQRP